MKKILVVAAIGLQLAGCSAYKVLSQPGPADLAGLGIGSPRQEVISRLGTPKMIDTLPDGQKQDMFEFQSGLHQASKARAVLYFAADFFTLFLAELVLWPLEMTALDSATCTALATYDNHYRVQTWMVSDRHNSAQGC